MGEAALRRNRRQGRGSVCRLPDLGRGVPFRQRRTGLGQGGDPRDRRWVLREHPSAAPRGDRRVNTSRRGGRGRAGHVHPPRRKRALGAVRRRLQDAGRAGPRVSSLRGRVAPLRSLSPKYTAAGSSTALISQPVPGSGRARPGSPGCTRPLLGCGRSRPAPVACPAPPACGTWVSATSPKPEVSRTSR